MATRTPAQMKAARANLKPALQAAHSPAARKKAIASVKRLSGLRGALAQQYNESPLAFNKGHLLDTIKKHHIPMSAIPEDLFHPFPVKVRAKLLEQHHAGGVMIPFDAVPPPAAKPNGKGEKKYYVKKADRAPNTPDPVFLAQLIVEVWKRAL